MSNYIQALDGQHTNDETVAVGRHPGPSNAAKAAAILVFTSGVPDYDTAVKVYDALAESDDIDATLSSFTDDICRWSHTETLDNGDWWCEIEMLATNIDKTREHFKELT